MLGLTELFQRLNALHLKMKISILQHCISMSANIYNNKRTHFQPDHSKAILLILVNLPVLFLLLAVLLLLIIFQTKLMKGHNYGRI